MMWKLMCLLLLWFYPHTGNAQFDLANQIIQQVNENLKDFNKDLSNKIFQQVTENLEKSNMFTQDLANQIFKQVSENLKMSNPFSKGGIGFNIQEQLAPLNNLGARINQQVQESLQPVYAMTIKNKMANGVGGVTVVTHFGNRPRIFIIQNGVKFQCNGDVQGSRCFGSLEPFHPTSSEDLCYAKYHVHVNDRICLSTRPINVQSFNGNVNCQSGEGAPMLFLDLGEYKRLCGNSLPWQVMYRYYPNPGDPNAVQLPTNNQYVQCMNSDPGYCEFAGDNTTAGGGNGLSGSFQSSNSGFYSSFGN